ncbi:MAG: hypothetical protein QW612_03885 [Candidatus Bathyarchaeia archaeon]
MSRRIFMVFVLLGLISLAADMVYEEVRSASGACPRAFERPVLRDFDFMKVYKI